MHQIYVRRLVPLCISTLLSSTLLIRAAYSQTPLPASVYAIVGAKIEVGDGRVIVKGVVVVRDGIITAVGADVKLPADAEIIKGDGLTVYPGFIDSYVSKGLTLPDPQPIQDTPTDTTSTVSPSMREANRKGVRPELRAVDVFALTDELAKPERLAGFTTELIVPSGGTINGVGTLANLNGLTRRDCVISPSVVMDFSFATSGAGYPGSQMGVIALTRQTLLDAQQYAVLQNAFANGAPPRPPDDPVLEALQPVVRGTLPALYTANTEREIRRALGIAYEFNLNLWINGGVEAYKAAAELSAKHVPVIVSLNFGPEPGVIVPAGGGGPGGGGGFQRPGGGGGGRRNRQGAAPGSVPGGAPPTTPGSPPAAPPARPGGSTPGGGPPAGAPPASGATPLPPVEDDTPKVVVAERHKKWDEKVANAGALSKAGVRIALSTGGVRNQTEFMTNLRKAIAAGLPREAALRALTIDAARMLKVDRQIGTVETGKSAALVVMNGDFADAKTTVQYLLIDRKKFEPAKDTGPVIQLPSRRRPGSDDDLDDVSDRP